MHTLRPYLALALTLLVFLSASNYAQTTSVDALYQSSQTLTAEISTLQTEAKGLTGERQESLRIRITERQLELLEVFDALSTRIVEEEQSGVDHANIKAKLAPQLLQLGPLIKTAINQRLKTMDNLDDAHTPLSVEWMLALSEHSKFIDGAYQALSQHAKNLAELKFNNKDSFAFLTQALQQRAEVLTGQIALTQKDLEANAKRLANSPADADTEQRLKALQDKLDIVTNSLKHTVTLLERNGIDAGRYKEILIRSTGDITADILDVGVVKRLTHGWITHVYRYLIDNGAAFFFKAIVFILILILFRYLSRSIAKLIHKSLAKSTMSISYLMEEMLVKLSARLVMFVGILIGLGQLGFSLAPILAGLGVIGFIVGFALQDTLGNFASGLMILIYRPYDVDDIIEAAGVQGKVRRMNLVSTTILTFDNQTLVIPNNKIWGDVIRNVTAQKHRRVDMVFGIGYSDNIELAEKTLKAILDDHPLVLSEPEHTVKLHTLNESSVDFVVRPWVETANYWEVYWDVTRAVKMHFDAAGISIPFPQRDVHIHQIGKQT